MHGYEGRLCVIEANHKLGEIVGRIAEEEQLEVQCFDGHERFLSEYRADAPTAVIVEHQADGIDGLALQDGLNRSEPTIAVVFATACKDVRVAVQAMKAGAQDYLVEPLRQTDLQVAVLDAIERSRREQEERERWSEARRRVARLSAREREILSLVVDGFSSKQIAPKLGIAHKTVDVHRSNIAVKLGADSLAQVVRLAIEAEAAEKAASQAARLLRAAGRDAEAPG